MQMWASVHTKRYLPFGTIVLQNKRRIFAYEEKTERAFYGICNDTEPFFRAWREYGMGDQATMRRGRRYRRSHQRTGSDGLAGMG